MNHPAHAHSIPPPLRAPPWNTPELSRGKRSQKDQQKDGCRVNSHDGTSCFLSLLLFVFFCFVFRSVGTLSPSTCPPSASMRQGHATTATVRRLFSSLSFSPTLPQHNTGWRARQATPPSAAMRDTGDTCECCTAHDTCGHCAAHDMSRCCAVHDTSEHHATHDTSRRCAAHDTSGRRAAHDTSECRATHDMSRHRAAHDTSRRHATHDTSERHTRHEWASRRARHEWVSHHTQHKQVSHRA